MKTDPVVEIFILAVGCVFLLLMILRGISSDGPSQPFRITKIFVRDLNETGEKNWTAIVMGVVILVALFVALVTRLLALVN